MPLPDPVPRAVRSIPATRVTHQFVGDNRVDTWDPHRARAPFAQRVHSLTYHRIVRPQRSSSTRWEADLCWLPEVPDVETFVFNLDPRATFQPDADGEGRLVTSEDVRLSVERLSSLDRIDDTPREHRRQAGDWDAIRFEAFDPMAEYQDPFVLKIDRGFIYHLRDVIAGPFSWIASAEAIDQAELRWPEESAGKPWTDGAGPYRLHSHRAQVTSLVRSNHWWASQRPDKHWHVHRLARLNAIRLFAGSAQDLMRMYAAAEVDMAGQPLVDTQIDALIEQFPEHQVHEVPGRSALQLVTPRDPEPAGALSDPRVALALSWSVDRAQLERSPATPVRLRPSGPVAPHFAELALADDELREHLGYQSSKATARSAVADLLGAAGGAEQIAPLKLVVLDEVARPYPELGETILRMVRRTSGLSIQLEHATRTDAMERLSDGECFAFLRWGETPVSPLPIGNWRRTLHSDGAENWGAFADPGLDQSLDHLPAVLDWEDLAESVGAIQRRLLSGSSTGWIHDVAVPVQRTIVQPWFSPDARLLDFAWSDQHLADCGIRLRGDSGYPADSRPLPDADVDAVER